MEEPGNPAELVHRLIDDVATHRKPAADLSAELIRDGCPILVDVDLAGRLIELAAQPNRADAERATVLEAMWELTVDPAVRTALGTVGLAADRGTARPREDPATATAEANRGVFRPLATTLAGFLTDRSSNVRDAAAAALATHTEIADLAGGQLATAYRTAPSVRILLACAVLAGTTRTEIAGFADLFHEVLATAPNSPAATVAAIGLRNMAVPGPIPRTATDRLRDAVRAESLDLRPWMTHNDSVRTASSLLLDDPGAHIELLHDALRNPDGDIRRRAVVEVWRGLCAWRDSESMMISLLVGQLTDTSPEVVENASGRLAFVPTLDSTAADTLAALAYESRTSTPLIKANAVLALATHGDERCLVTIRQALPKPGPFVGMALRGLGAHAPALIPAIRSTLRHGASAGTVTRVADILRAVATWSPTNEPWPEVVDLLTDHRLRMPALELLGTVAPPGIADRIEPLLYDTEPATRARAAWAGWRTTGNIAHALNLYRQMMTGSAVERREAATWMTRLGPDAQELAPYLAENQHHGNRHVAMAAARALVAVGAHEAVDPIVLLESLRSPRDAIATLRVIADTSSPFKDVDEAVQRIAESKKRYTWPDIADMAVRMDTELKNLALRRFGQS